MYVLQLNKKIRGVIVIEFLVTIGIILLGFFSILELTHFVYERIAVERGMGPAIDYESRLTDAVINNNQRVTCNIIQCIARTGSADFINGTTNCRATALTPAWLNKGSVSNTSSFLYTPSNALGISLNAILPYTPMLSDNATDLGLNIIEVFDFAPFVFSPQIYSPLLFTTGLNCNYANN